MIKAMDEIKNGAVTDMLKVSGVYIDLVMGLVNAIITDWCDAAGLAGQIDS